jgi:26S proteasome regulatory subunit N10
MPLESCMILLDTSEYMRNGDYVPTRMEAQHDAANFLVGVKTQSHPESTVGVSAGTELLISPTEDVGKILSALHNLPFRPHVPDVTASVQVASLALKHRRNKNGGQRIVLFVGSPLGTIDSRLMTKAGKQLRKNNISIDVVLMGELEENESKLRDLVEAANGVSDDENRTCHLVTIPAGVLPSDVLASSPVVHGPGGSGVAAGGGGGAMGGDAGFGAFAEFGGVDPNMDPELAMALRISMEEERARQERLLAASTVETSNTVDEVTDAPRIASQAPSNFAMDLGLSEEEALLQQALAMSMNENDPPEDGATSAMDAEDEEAMRLALQMSMQPEENEETPQQFQDPQFVTQLLGSLPGVDPNDPQIQNALRESQKDEKKDNDETGDKE